MKKKPFNKFEAGGKSSNKSRQTRFTNQPKPIPVGTPIPSNGIIRQEPITERVACDFMFMVCGQSWAEPWEHNCTEEQANREAWGSWTSGGLSGLPLFSCTNEHFLDNVDENAYGWRYAVCCPGADGGEGLSNSFSEVSLPSAFII